MGQPLRVLQLIDSLVRDGAEQSLATLAPYLSKEGVDVHVAYLVEPGDLHREIEQTGIPVHSLVHGPASRQQWLSRTIELTRRLKPAVVHTTLFEADLAGRRAAGRLNVPCVSSLVNTAYGRTEFERDGLRLTRVRAAQVADALTARRVVRFHAVTRHVASVMSRRLLIPRRKIEVIPRGRDSKMLGRRSADRRVATRRLLGVSDDVTVILAIGRQEPQKGFDVLINAVPYVRSRHPDIRVFVAGREGRATESLAILASELRVNDQVTFLGVRDDVADLLSAADVLAFPSLWEGAAGTLIEAMALECPIVASRLPTILETADETIATHVPPGDVAELARGLLAVLADKNAALQRARTGRVRFEHDYTIKAGANLMARFYSRAVTSAT